jgi:N-methylhydantoinase A/oxoprolinase/acetone carboxylase beta subunit
MSETLLVALIAGGSAIFGGAVTGAFTYLASVRQRETERYKRRLIQCYRDIIAFYHLEELYIQKLATVDRSTNSIKLEMRRTLREAGNESPSEDATPQKCERRMQELS